MDRNEIKLIVFDCDGVMFDSKPANREYYNHLLKHFHKPEMDEKELEFVHTHSVDKCTRHIFRNHPDITLEQIERFRKSIDYSSFLKYFEIEKDLVSFLVTAKKLGFHLAISTNRSDTMQLLLDEFSLTQYFGKVVTAVTAPKPKPAPDGMYEILDFFKVSSEETIFIGDSIIDYHHAANSNVTLVAFKNSELATRYHISSFGELWSLPFNLAKKKNQLDTPLK